MALKIAYVNFFREKRGRKVVAIDTIDDFHPRSHGDFCEDKTYQATWDHMPTEGSFSSKGLFDCKIFCLGVDMTDLDHEAKQKGLRLPSTATQQPELKIPPSVRSSRASSCKRNTSRSKVKSSKPEKLPPNPRRKKDCRITVEDEVRHSRAIQSIAKYSDIPIHSDASDSITDDCTDKPRVDKETKLSPKKKGSSKLDTMKKLEDTDLKVPKNSVVESRDHSVKESGTRRKKDYRITVEDEVQHNRAIQSIDKYSDIPIHSDASDSITNDCTDKPRVDKETKLSPKKKGSSKLDTMKKLEDTNLKVPKNSVVESRDCSVEQSGTASSNSVGCVENPSPCRESREVMGKKDVHSVPADVTDNPFSDDDDDDDEDDGTTELSEKHQSPPLDFNSNTTKTMRIRNGNDDGDIGEEEENDGGEQEEDEYQSSEEARDEQIELYLNKIQKQEREIKKLKVEQTNCIEKINSLQEEVNTFKLETAGLQSSIKKLRALNDRYCATNLRLSEMVSAAPKGSYGAAPFSPRNSVHSLSPACSPSPALSSSPANWTSPALSSLPHSSRKRTSFSVDDSPHSKRSNIRKHLFASDDKGRTPKPSKKEGISKEACDESQKDNAELSGMIYDALKGKAPLRNDGDRKVHIGNGVYISSDLFHDKIMKPTVSPTIALRDVMGNIYLDKELSVRSLEGGTPVKGNKKDKKQCLTPAKREACLGLYRAKVQFETGSRDKDYLDLCVSGKGRATMRYKLKEAAKKVRKEQPAFKADHVEEKTHSSKLGQCTTSSSKKRYSDMKHGSDKKHHS